MLLIGLVFLVLWSLQKKINWSNVMQPSNRRLGKSHIVREIDAMGGLMSRATDMSVFSIEL